MTLGFLLHFGLLALGLSDTKVHQKNLNKAITMLYLSQILQKIAFLSFRLFGRQNILNVLLFVKQDQAAKSRAGREKLDRAISEKLL